MGKKLPERKVTFSPGISPEHGLECLEWAKEYCEIFEDKYFCRNLDSVLFKRTVSKAFIILAEKRMENISIEQIKDPTLYIDKYKKYLASLFILKSCNKVTGKPFILPIEFREIRRVSPEDYEIIIDLICFFQKAGYYTDKQLKLIKYLWKRNSGTWFDDSVLEIESYNHPEIESIFKSKLQTPLAKKVKEGKSASEVIVNNFKEKKEDKIEKVKQKFFSLDKIRENLLVESEL